MSFYVVEEQKATRRAYIILCLLLVSYLIITLFLLLTSYIEPQLNSGVVIRKEFNEAKEWVTTKFNYVYIGEVIVPIPYTQRHYKPPSWYVVIEGQVYIEKKDKWVRKQRRVSVTEVHYKTLSVGDSFMVDLVE